jgi:hypothetical protein
MAQPFSLNQLVIAAWEARPDIFGMAEHPHPDKHKIHVMVFGKSGLVSRGEICKTETGLLRVSVVE